MRVCVVARREGGCQLNFVAWKLDQSEYNLQIDTKLLLTNDDFIAPSSKCHLLANLLRGAPSSFPERRVHGQHFCSGFLFSSLGL